MTLLADIVKTSRVVTETSRRNAKIDAIAACLRRLQAGEIAIGVAYLSGETRQGRQGIGYALIRAASHTGAAAISTLTLAEVDNTLTLIGTTTGAGSNATRARLLSELLQRATEGERDFLARLLLGALRQGALAGLMVDAVAAAAALPVAMVRRAAMVAGGVAAIAPLALTEGAAGLTRYSIVLMQPVAPMLAQPADDIAAALDQLGTAAFEWKLDGARVQVHKAGDEVRIFTRNSNDVTVAAPEIVAAMRSLSARELILDGEAITLRADGTLEVGAAQERLPLSVFFFDCLLRDGDPLIDQTGAARFESLAEVVPPALRIPREVTGDRAVAEAFFEDALKKGHEGVMAKSLSARYEAGRRGVSWLKVKRTTTLDLVVLAAEWGHGRRRGWLSNLHLGARDPTTGGWIMLGKTFKGMTDEILAWQTEQLLAREVNREYGTVHVRPELVVEIAFNDLQASPRYPGRLALRFARLKRYRNDKTATEADTIDIVRAIYEGQVARGQDD